MVRVPLPTPVSEHYTAQQRLVTATLALVRAAWRRMDLDDLDGSWDALSPLMVRIVSRGQLAAAGNGAGYVGPTLDALGQSVKPDALVRVSGFVGFASDGRSVMTLLEGAKIVAKRSQSLEVGGKWLEMVTHTQIADAARQAASVDMFTRKGVGYVRAVNPPCCQRCAVLAGRFYKVGSFLRHPRCDCFMVPTTVAQPNGFGQSVEPEQVKDLTKAQRQAIADGADMNRVINSHRAGSRAKNGLTTTEGATRRGIAGKRLDAERGKRAARLTPEGIYRIAGDRDEALGLLRRHGYII